MSYHKPLSIVLWVLTLLPIAGSYFNWWGLVAGEWTNTNTLLLIYAILYFALFCALVAKSQRFDKRQKRAWYVCLFFFYPFSELVLPYFLFWAKPFRVATTIDEQVEILRELQDEK